MSLIFNILIFLSYISSSYMCGSSISVEDNPHLFDKLFFNTTDDEFNVTEIIVPNDSEVEVTTSPTTTTTVTMKPTTTTTTFKPAPKLFLNPIIKPQSKSPFFMSFPELPKLFGFSRPKWLPFGKPVDYTSKLINNPTFRMQISPAVGWTYCYPGCGSGDQALDSENAMDNVQMDMYSAISYALDILKLGIIQEDQISIRFSPRNTLLEEFEDGHDRRGTMKYRIIRGSVRYYYDDKNPGNINENLQDLDFSIKSSVSLTQTVWKTFANEVTNYLTKEKYVVVKNPARLVSYSIIKHTFFI